MVGTNTLTNSATMPPTTKLRGAGFYNSHHYNYCQPNIGHIFFQNASSFSPLSLQMRRSACSGTSFFGKLFLKHICRFLAAPVTLILTYHNQKLNIPFAGKRHILTKNNILATFLFAFFIAMKARSGMLSASLF